MSYMTHFNEKELMNDLLMSEKQITSLYNTGITDAMNMHYRDALNICLSNVQNCQFEILEAMSQRGWHKVKKADSDDVESAKRKFLNLLNELK